jgi:putative ABC transport system ATP-binding protein
MKHIILGKDIVKTFGKGNEQSHALDGVTIEIDSGEFTALMGPSGSGKSTLLYALSGMDEITSGSVTFCGMELSALREHELADIRRTKMGFIFQQPTMLKNLNILDNIILPATQGSKKDIATVREKAKLLMKKTGIDGLENREISEVSGGQLQRAGICRALMNDPEILFADEPTGALNSKSAEEIMDLLEAIHKEGTAILIVTHDAKVAARASRVLFTKDGKIAAETHFGDIADNSITARTEKVIADMAVVER